MSIFNKFFRKNPDKHKSLTSEEKNISLVPETKTKIPSVDLIKASHDGDTFAVKELLNSGHDPNAGNNNNVTALFMAAQNGHTETAKLLIERGANVNSTFLDDGETPLISASKSNHKEIVSILLDNGALVDVKGGMHGRTALHEAAHSGYAEIVKILLARGADFNATDVRGYTPLKSMEAGLFYNKNQESFKITADLLRNVEKSQKLVWTTTISDIDQQLLDAVSKENTLNIERLINEGADVNIKDSDRTPVLLLAIKSNNIDVTQVLLDNKANYDFENAEGYNALAIASGMAFGPIVKSLLASGANPNNIGTIGLSALCLATAQGHDSIVKELLSNGADVNQKNKSGLTALMIAAQNGWTNLIDILLKSGANINEQADSKLTALHESCMSEHVDAVKLLIENGADVNSRDHDGGTCLIETSSMGNAVITQLLINSQADTNAKSDLGRTPLYWACRNGRIDVVKLLLNNGADLNIKYNSAFEENLTPLMVASNNGHENIVRLLEDISNTSQTLSGNSSNKSGDNKFQIIPIREYSEFFISISKKIGTIDPDVVYSRIAVYCEKCSIRYNQDSLAVLFIFQSSVGAKKVLIMGATNEGNDLRSGKCPNCGHTRFNILVQD